MPFVDCCECKVTMHVGDVPEHDYLCVDCGTKFAEEIKHHFLEQTLSSPPSSPDTYRRDYDLIVAKAKRCGLEWLIKRTKALEGLDM